LYVQKEQVGRLHYILAIKDSALNVPVNLEARRRLQFFSNSLFMSMPQPRPVRNIFSFRSITLFLSSPLQIQADGMFVDIYHHGSTSLHLIFCCHIGLVKLCIHFLSFRQDVFAFWLKLKSMELSLVG